MATDAQCVVWTMEILCGAVKTKKPRYVIQMFCAQPYSEVVLNPQIISTGAATVEV